MLRIFLKALIVIWPWLKAAIFKDRTVCEVVAENKHLTAMLVLIVSLIVILVLTTNTLSAYKEEYQKLRTVYEASAPGCMCDTLEQRKQRLSSLLQNRTEQ